jgi:predicted SAM-dependent methyltransferase
MNYLNLGCGKRFHKDWVNLDFVSNSPFVKAHNLLNGIPFENNTFDVVYHSHVLEHFNQVDGKKFIKECYRVLKSGGIIRIAVPDLEQIVRQYLKKLEESLDGNIQSQYDYNWIMLELFDQTVRNTSGGEMAKYLIQDQIPNEKYVYERVGQEAKDLREQFFNAKKNPQANAKVKTSPFRFLSINYYLNKFKKPTQDEKEMQALKIGKFRLGGEIHQWMYDRFSLQRLLTDVGFTDFEVKSVAQSNINHWHSYELEEKNGVVFKPDSLFVEAKKTDIARI